MILLSLETPLRHLDPKKLFLLRESLEQQQQNLLTPVASTKMKEGGRKESLVSAATDRSKEPKDQAFVRPEIPRASAASRAGSSSAKDLHEVEILKDAGNNADSIPYSASIATLECPACTLENNLEEAMKRQFHCVVCDSPLFKDSHEEALATGVGTQQIEILQQSGDIFEHGNDFDSPQEKDNHHSHVISSIRPSSQMKAHISPLKPADIQRKSPLQVKVTTQSGQRDTHDIPLLKRNEPPMNHTKELLSSTGDQGNIAKTDTKSMPAQLWTGRGLDGTETLLIEETQPHIVVSILQGRNLIPPTATGKQALRFSPYVVATFNGQQQRTEIAPAPGGSAIWDSHVCFVMPCVSSNFDDTNSSSSAAIESNRIASTLELVLMAKRGGLVADQAIGKLQWAIAPANLRTAPSQNQHSQVSREIRDSSSSNLIVREDSDLDVSLCHAEWFPLIPLKNDLVMAELNVSVTVTQLRRLPSQLRRLREARHCAADVVKGLEALTCMTFASELRLEEDLRRATIEAEEAVSKAAKIDPPIIDLLTPSDFVSPSSPTSPSPSLVGTVAPMDALREGIWALRDQAFKVASAQQPPPSCAVQDTFVVRDAKKERPSSPDTDFFPETSAKAFQTSTFRALCTTTIMQEVLSDPTYRSFCSSSSAKDVEPQTDSAMTAYRHILLERLAEVVCCNRRAMEKIGAKLRQEVTARVAAEARLGAARRAAVGRANIAMKLANALEIQVGGIIGGPAEKKKNADDNMMTHQIQRTTSNLGESIDVETSLNTNSDLKATRGTEGGTSNDFWTVEVALTGSNNGNAELRNLSLIIGSSLFLPESSIQVQLDPDKTISHLLCVANSELIQRHRDYNVPLMQLRTEDSSDKNMQLPQEKLSFSSPPPLSLMIIGFENLSNMSAKVRSLSCASTLESSLPVKVNVTAVLSPTPSALQKLVAEVISPEEQVLMTSAELLERFMVVELTNKDKPETDDDGVFKNKNGTVATSTDSGRETRDNIILSNIEDKIEQFLKKETSLLAECDAAKRETAVWRTAKERWVNQLLELDSAHQLAAAGEEAARGALAAARTRIETLQGIVSKVEQRAENAERLFLEAEEAARNATAECGKALIAFVLIIMIIIHCFLYVHRTIHNLLNFLSQSFSTNTSLTKMYNLDVLKARLSRLSDDPTLFFETESMTKAQQRTLQRHKKKELQKQQKQERELAKFAKQEQRQRQRALKQQESQAKNHQIALQMEEELREEFIDWSERDEVILNQISQQTFTTPGSSVYMEDGSGAEVGDASIMDDTKCRRSTLIQRQTRGRGAGQHSNLIQKASSHNTAKNTSPTRESILKRFTMEEAGRKLEIYESEQLERMPSDENSIEEKDSGNSNRRNWLGLRRKNRHGQKYSADTVAHEETTEDILEQSHFTDEIIQGYRQQRTRQQGICNAKKTDQKGPPVVQNTAESNLPVVVDWSGF